MLQKIIFNAAMYHFETAFLRITIGKSLHKFSIKLLFRCYLSLEPITNPQVRTLLWHQLAPDRVQNFTQHRGFTALIEIDNTQRIIMSQFAVCLLYISFFLFLPLASNWNNTRNKKTLMLHEKDSKNKLDPRNVNKLKVVKQNREMLEAKKYYFEEFHAHDNRPSQHQLDEWSRRGSIALAERETNGKTERKTSDLGLVWWVNMRKYLHTQWRPRRAADPLCMQLSCGGRSKNLSIELLSTFNKDQLCVFFFGMENASPNRRIMPMRLIYNALRGRARCHTQLITIDVLPHNSARLFVCSYAHMCRSSVDF